MTRRTNWSTHLTFGGEPLTSRACLGAKVAATDHCVAIIKTCPHCLSHYVATPEQPDHCEDNRDRHAVAVEESHRRNNPNAPTIYDCFNRAEDLR